MKIMRKYSAVEGGISYLSAVLSYIVVSLIATTVLSHYAEGTNEQIILTFAFNVLVEICFLVSALYPSKITNGHVTYDFEKIKIADVALALLITIVCIFGFSGLSYSFNFGLEFLGYKGEEIFTSDSALQTVVNTMLVVLIAPVCEEILLRGSVLSSLSVCVNMSNKKRIPFMITLCGILFALLHMNPTQTVYQFFFGCALAYVTLRFGSVTLAVIMHAFNNAVGIVLALPAVDGVITPLIKDVMSTPIGYVLFTLVSIMLAVGAGLVIKLFGRHEGGETPFSPTRSHPDDEPLDRADNGGTLAGFILLITGMAITLTMWITKLVVGFTI